MLMTCVYSHERCRDPKVALIVSAKPTAAFPGLLVQVIDFLRWRPPLILRWPTSAASRRDRSCIHATDFSNVRLSDQLSALHEGAIKDTNLPVQNYSEILNSGDWEPCSPSIPIHDDRQLS